MSRSNEPDRVRRKLLQSSAALGGLFVAGSLPWEKPAVKSFFGTQAAWAQPTPDFACDLFPGPGVTRCGQNCFNIGLLDSERTIIFVQNTGLQPFTVENIDGSVCSTAPVAAAAGAGASLAAALPVVLQPGQTEPITVGPSLCGSFSGPFPELCLELITTPAAICPPFRVRGSCP